MNSRLVKAKVNSVLEIAKDYISTPINIFEVAKLRGLSVKPFDLGEDVSGLLAIENGVGTIGYNKNEAKVRQRFTIAHELGHYELHSANANLFVDKDFKIYRSNVSGFSKEALIMEKEANAFAAEILMPEQLVLTEIKDFDIDLTDSDSVKILAKRFQVSSIAMQYRIMNIGLIV